MENLENRAVELIAGFYTTDPALISWWINTEKQENA